VKKMAIGFSIEPTRENSLLELFVTKLGYRVEDFNADALLMLNRVTIPPGLNSKLPDNLLADEPPSPCDGYVVVTD
jgi:hypothetical protein